MNIEMLTSYQGGAGRVVYTPDLQRDLDLLMDTLNQTAEVAGLCTTYERVLRNVNGQLQTFQVMGRTHTETWQLTVSLPIDGDGISAMGLQTLLQEGLASGGHGDITVTLNH